MTPVIACLRVFGKGRKADGSEQTTAEFAAEVRKVSGDHEFIREIFAFGQANGMIDKGQTLEVTNG